MNSVINILARTFMNVFVRNILKKHKLVFYTLFIITIVLVCSYKTYGAEYEYKGVYPFQSVITSYCEDCYLELPPDLMKTEIVLSVSTDSEKSLFKAIVASTKSQGWNLTRQGQKLYAEPIQNEGNIVYISCLDNQPHNIPKYLYSAQIKSDNILCYKRDSLAAEKKMLEDSLALYNRHITDSVVRYNDSIANLPPLDFRSYELRYYSYSKSFTDKIGVEWGSVIWSGNLHNRLHVYEDWKLWAAENNDTTFNYRNMFLSVDSTLQVDWGSEEQVISKVYQNDGVITQDYEWRKYGLIITIQRDSRRVRMDYTFRDKDNSVSVLQGSVIGNEGDTLFLRGDYMAKREISTGLPLFARIPIIRLLFATENFVNDMKNFELYLIPQKSFAELRDSTAEIVKPKIGGKK